MAQIRFRQSQNLANETEAQSQTRREAVAARIALVRANESQENREGRLQQQTNRQRNVRRTNRQSMLLKAKDYDPSQPIISSIGEMNIVCGYCNAVKFPKETKGFRRKS